MKKERVVLVIGIITILISSIISVYAANYIYNSNEVEYDNTNKNITSTNVQGAIDELYVDANNYSSINTRVTNLETIVTDTAGFHNSVFRGKDITSYYNDGSLYTRISSGKFTDLYVGDYIIKNGINWRIAGFDIYLGKGDTALTTHHAVIVPDTKLTTARMNASNTTEGGYVGSEMYTTTLPNVLTTYITPVFGTHVLEYRNLLTTGMSSTLTNRYGSASGSSNNWTWQTRKLDLMNENQVGGSIVWSSSGYETGSDNTQFPLFRLAPEYIQKERYWYWLRNVTHASCFADVSSDGHSDHGKASYTSGGIKPYFYID